MYRNKLEQIGPRNSCNPLFLKNQRNHSNHNKPRNPRNQKIQRNNKIKK